MTTSRRRNTAKTGDKSLYNVRRKRTDINKKKKTRSDDNDLMYNEVERYNREIDVLRDDVLHFNEGDGDKSEEENGMGGDIENVFDLGLGQSDNESEESGITVEKEDEYEGKDYERTNNFSHDEKYASRNDFKHDDDVNSSGNSDKITEPHTFNWGIRKRDYYYGDTADLELGQDVEDAELEEEAGKEVLKARLQDMREDDYFETLADCSDYGGTEDRGMETKNGRDSGLKISMISGDNKRRHFFNLSKKDKIDLMTKNHLELLSLITHFRNESVRPCHEETMVVLNSLLKNEENAKAVGATSSGIKYLISKAMVQISTTLNVCQYLLMKAENAKVKQGYDSFHDDILDDEYENDIKSHPVIRRLSELHFVSNDISSKIESRVTGILRQLGYIVEASELMMNGDTDDGVEEDDYGPNRICTEDHVRMSDASPNCTNEELVLDSSDDENHIMVQRRVINEARFSLRQNDDENLSSDTTTAKSVRPRFSSTIYYGDEENKDDDVATAGSDLASTVNKITQKTKSCTEKSSAPDINDDYENFEKGIAIMRADLRTDDEKFNKGDYFNDLDGDKFYSAFQKSTREKKEMKKSKYNVTLKYPGVDDEIEGERAVGRVIMKNRGLVAHKNKLSRNPRVKKREQYRKALIRRRGTVREVRTDEAHKYGGEDTGIRSSLSRSRKLGVPH